MSGVPQGSILGPILLYVNDLPDVVNNAKVASFADDTKLFKCVDSHIDGASIQSDLDNLEEWPTSSELVFNQNECKCQRITRKKTTANPFIRDFRCRSTYEPEHPIGCGTSI